MCCISCSFVSIVSNRFSNLSVAVTTSISLGDAGSLCSEDGDIASVFGFVCGGGCLNAGSLIAGDALNFGSGCDTTMLEWSAAILFDTACFDGSHSYAMAEARAIDQS